MKEDIQIMETTPSSSILSMHFFVNPDFETIRYLFLNPSSPVNSAFLYAGTKPLIATLWKIDDRLTADFMTEF